MHCAMPFCSTSANVVALGELLSLYESAFQIAVRHSLAEEGFELGSRLPNLQLAREIQASIGWNMEHQGFSEAWESLRSFLERADQLGILVDLSQDHWAATA